MAKILKMLPVLLPPPNCKLQSTWTNARYAKLFFVYFFVSFLCFDHLFFVSLVCTNSPAIVFSRRGGSCRHCADCMWYGAIGLPPRAFQVQEPRASYPFKLSKPHQGHGDRHLRHVSSGNNCTPVTFQPLFDAGVCLSSRQLMQVPRCFFLC